jgi:hypothetical protein
MRFRSGNMKSEAIALFIFTFVLFSSYDLFKNGFWTTYNRSFGTIKHAFREFRDSENIVLVAYEYSFNGLPKKGTGYIIDADENHLELYSRADSFSEGRIIIIDSKDNRTKNISVQPTKTNYKYSVEDFKFFNLPLQRLNDTLHHKIVSGKILSSVQFQVNKYEALKGSIELNKEISPKFQWLKNDTLKNKLSNKLEIKKLELREITSYNNLERNKLQGLENQLFQYQLSLKNANNIYSKNKSEQLIIQEKKKIANFSLNLKSTISVLQEITFLKREMNYKIVHTFTGDLKLFSVPNNVNDFVANN